jgi:hypothetical protein
VKFQKTAAEIQEWMWGKAQKATGTGEGKPVRQAAKAVLDSCGRTRTANKEISK